MKKRKSSDSHPWNFAALDLGEMAAERDRWLSHNHPLDCISVDTVRAALHDALRGAYARIQWLWEQLEPADAILATCVDRRLGALAKIPWGVRKRDGLSDIEDALAEAQRRTLQDLANAICNLDEGIAALAQASFRGFRHVQLLEDSNGNLRINATDNWNWCRAGYKGSWYWNPAATYGLTIGEEPPVPRESIISRMCPRPIDQPGMMLCLDRKNSKAQWLVFNGRYGTPPLYVVMPDGIDEPTKKDYIEFARQCISNAAGVLPSGSDVKAVTPGTQGPDTFKQLIDLSTQELVLRATGGLMTMLTAPGAGTNTDTGSSHQDAFEDLAEAEGRDIAAILQEGLFAPALDQWHPGQPHLVEFAIERPDAREAVSSVQTISTLAAAGYRTSDQQVGELTGLDVTSANMALIDDEAQPSAAINAMARRFAPTILYPPARAVFHRAVNAAADRRQIPTDTPLTTDELAVLADLAHGALDPQTIAAEAKTAEMALKRAIKSETDDEPKTSKHPVAVPLQNANSAQ